MNTPMLTQGLDLGVFFHSLKDLEQSVNEGKQHGISDFVAFPMSRHPEVIDWKELSKKWQVKIHTPHLFFHEDKFRSPAQGPMQIALLPDSIQLQEAYATFLKAHDYQALLLSFPHEKSLSPTGMAHEGAESFRLGLPELSPLQESLRVARDCELAQYFNLRLHFHQVSCKASVDIIRTFRKRGLPITAGVSALHLMSTVKDIIHFQSQFKSIPPLRNKEDQMALWGGIADGTVSTICSGVINYDHEDNFFEAPFGIKGLGHFLPELKEIFSRPPYSINLLHQLIDKNPRRILAGELH